jgi:hypothetical protein
MASFIRLSLAAGFLLSFTPICRAQATLNIRPTNLVGAPRVNGQVTVLTAVNADNQPVADNAVISPPAAVTGEIQVVIKDPNVRAVTLLVEAGDALSATLTNVLVVNQTTFIALPNADQAPCVCVSYSPRIRRGWRR